MEHCLSRFLFAVPEAIHLKSTAACFRSKQQASIMLEAGEKRGASYRDHDRSKSLLLGIMSLLLLIIRVDWFQIFWQVKQIGRSCRGVHLVGNLLVKFLQTQWLTIVAVIL